MNNFVDLTEKDVSWDDYDAVITRFGTDPSKTKKRKRGLVVLEPTETMKEFLKEVLEVATILRNSSRFQRKFGECKHNATKKKKDKVMGTFMQNVCSELEAEVFVHTLIPYLRSRPELTTHGGHSNVFIYEWDGLKLLRSLVDDAGGPKRLPRS
jgi:hypothetical protein